MSGTTNGRRSPSPHRHARAPQHDTPLYVSSILRAKRKEGFELIKFGLVHKAGRKRGPGGLFSRNNHWHERMYVVCRMIGGGATVEMSWYMPGTSDQRGTVVVDTDSVVDTTNDKGWQITHPCKKESHQGRYLSTTGEERDEWVSTLILATKELYLHAAMAADRRAEQEKGETFYDADKRAGERREPDTAAVLSSLRAGPLVTTVASSSLRQDSDSGSNLLRQNDSRKATTPSGLSAGGETRGGNGGGQGGGGGGGDGRPSMSLELHGGEGGRKIIGRRYSNSGNSASSFTTTGGGIGDDVYDSPYFQEPRGDGGSGNGSGGARRGRASPAHSSSSSSSSSSNERSGAREGDRGSPPAGGGSNSSGASRGSPGVAGSSGSFRPRRSGSGSGSGEGNQLVELFENHRWVPLRGWSGKFLLPTDRKRREEERKRGREEERKRGREERRKTFPRI